MKLYDEGIEIDIPGEYKDISGLIAAQNYQYMFACDTTEQDNFLIIDLMQPIPEVDLHIEEILGMNDVEKPRIIGIEYTCEQFIKSLNIFLSRYKGKIIPQRVENPEDSLEWVSVWVEGRVTRSDGKERKIYITVSIVKYSLSDVVISMFNEDDLTEERKENIRKMNRSIRILNPGVFVA